MPDRWTVHLDPADLNADPWLKCTLSWNECLSIAPDTSKRWFNSMCLFVYVSFAFSPQTRKKNVRRITLTKQLLQWTYFCQVLIGFVLLCCIVWQPVIDLTYSVVRIPFNEFSVQYIVLLCVGEGPDIIKHSFIPFQYILVKSTCL